MPTNPAVSPSLTSAFSIVRGIIRRSASCRLCLRRHKFHRARNLLAKVPARAQTEVKAAYWAIFDVPTDVPPGEQAEALVQQRIQAFTATYNTVRCLLQDHQALPVYLRFAREHWHRIRHTNVIWVNRPTGTRLADTIRACGGRQRFR
jgi:transposase-like protein